MPRMPIFGPGLNAKSSFVTAKLMQNLYPEVRPAGEKSAIVAYGTPGLTLLYDPGAGTPSRGGIEFEKNNVAYFVRGGTFYELNNAGVVTNRGTLGTTTGRVSMAHNGVQVMLVDGTNGYIYNTTTLVFVQITDLDFPANPTTCCFLARRFIVNFRGSSRFYVSAIDNGLAWDALMFANAETNPDPIVAVYESNGQLILLGPKTTEFWGLSGAADFPYISLQGTATEWGLAAVWSIAKYDNSFCCLITNRMGQVMIAKMEGYLPKPISNFDLASLINGYSTAADASAYSYMLGGHPMYVINFPTAGKSWLYDGSVGYWSALKSFGITRHRAEFAFPLLNSTIVADYNDGKLYRLDPTALTDNGDSIESEFVSENIANQELGFIEADCVRLDMETGVGLAVGQGSNPQVALSVSRDNGKTWGPDMWKTAGAVGQYRTRVEWRRLGTAREFSFKFRVTDPVRRTFVSACLNPED